jgi:hypothetical protein
MALVLGRGAQRSTSANCKFFRQATHAVVALDVRGSGAATRFDDIRVGSVPARGSRSTHHPPRFRDDEIGGRGFKERMNSRPIILRLVPGSLRASASRNWSTASVTVTSRTPVEAT